MILQIVTCTLIIYRNIMHVIEPCNIISTRLRERPAKTRSLIQVFAGRPVGSQGSKRLHTDSEDSDQHAHLCRLI